MSIHPQHAEAILDGRKTVELRKRPLADDIDTVVIYATSPVRKIVGLFTIGETWKAEPNVLWKMVQDFAAVDEVVFDSYFGDADIGVAIVVERPQRVEQVSLGELEPSPTAPQSFCYLAANVLDQLEMAG